MVKRLVHAWIVGMSYRFKATEVTTVTREVLTELALLEAPSLIPKLLVMPKAEILSCLYELYAHGDGDKLLSLWNHEPIREKIYHTSVFFHPLSLNGLMFKTLVSYLEMNS